MKTKVRQMVAIVGRSTDESGRESPKSAPRRINRLEEANIIDQPLAGTLRDMNAARDMIAQGEDLALH